MLLTFEFYYMRINLFVVSINYKKLHIAPELSLKDNIMAAAECKRKCRVTNRITVSTILNISYYAPFLTRTISVIRMEHDSKR